MSKRTEYCFRELCSVLSICLVAQTVFNSSSRDLASSSHLCKNFHMHGEYTYMYAFMCVCMCVCSCMEGIYMIQNRMFQSL